METSPPFFSVITVCRNAETAIAATAESLCAQVFTDYEWIVIDGASTDNTCDIVCRYLKSPRDTIISEPDDGVYDAMNKGLRHACGKFVLFLNAGDLLADPRTLELVRDAIDETVDILHGDVIFSLPRGGSVYRRSKEASGGVDRRLFASHQSVYVRRKTHLNQPFDVSLRIAADFAVIAALHAKGAQFRYLPAALSITLVNDDAISIKGRPRMAWEDLRINRSICGRSLFSAYAIYFKTRAKIAIVSTLKALPTWVFRRLPARLRERSY